MTGDRARPTSRLACLAAVIVAVTALGPTAASAEPCTVRGGIGAYWSSLGGASSFLGPCVGPEGPVTGGAAQVFQGGTVYWSHTTGAHEVHGSIRTTYDRLDAADSVVGLPITRELRTVPYTGAYNHFQRGSIFWSPSTGAHEVRGSIRARWQALGWEKSPLGYPTTDETPTASGTGASHRFQRGAIYWSGATGAHEVRNGIAALYAQLGAERGPLGYPVRGEVATPVLTGSYSAFQGGAIYWSPATGVKEVHGPIAARWSSLGRENSTLGFPVSNQYAVPGGFRSDFQGGSLLLSTSTSAVTQINAARPAFTYSVGTVDAASLGASYRAGCPLAPSSLRALRLTHHEFNGHVRSGTLVVNASLAPQTVRAFHDLYLQRFPMTSIAPLSAFGGSDDASMAANNTSGFNCRTVAGSSSWSEHSYGLAIDINPVQNPYVRGTSVQPPAGAPYAYDRSPRPGVITSGGPVVRSLATAGYQWGGYWTNSKDYQHFSTTGR